MTDLRGVAYDAGFKQNEPRDWHGRWAYSQFEKLSNTLQIKKLEDMPDELYRSIKLHMQAVDTKASADDVERVARGVNDAFDEIEKKAPGIYNYVKNKNSWLRAPFLFLDYGPDFQGTSMTTYSDERTGDFAWFANVACIPHMTHRATTGEGINFASKWCHNHPTKDVAAQYFKLCMEHEFAHYVDLANTGGSLSRDFARVILKAAGIPKARTPSFFRDFEKKYEQQFINFVKDNISEYALDDPTEAFAEGFNRWLTDDNFNPVLKEFFDYHFKRKWIDDDAMTDAANSHIVFHHFPDPKNKGEFKRENWREAFEHPTQDTTIGVQYFTSKEAPPSLTERAFGTAEANKGENEFERQRQYGQTKDSMVGAGMALIDPDGNALFVKRDEHGDHPGEWCFPGGKINEGESEIQAAEREVIEEIGSASFTRNYHGEVVSNDPVPFKTFLKPVQWQFEPAWLMEHTDHVWASIANPPSPLHPGTAEVLEKLRGVADAGYDPNEPRDWHGRWTEETVNALSKRYGVNVTTEPNDIDMEAMAWHGGGKIFTTKHFNESELKEYAKNWEGLQVDPSKEGILTHEFGHALHHWIENKIGTKEFEKILSKYVPLDERKYSNTKMVSPYAMENRSEFMAETFVTFNSGGKKHESGAFSNTAIPVAMGLWTELLNAAKLQETKES